MAHFVQEVFFDFMNNTSVRLIHPGGEKGSGKKEAPVFCTQTQRDRPASGSGS